MSNRSEVWRVVTANIWNRGGPWLERLPLLRAGLLDLDPDVVGLQEVLAMPGQPSQADEIFAGTGWHIYNAPAWHLGGGLTFGNAIASKHRLHDTETIALPTPAGLDTRSIAFARVDAPHGPMPVFVTHLTVQAHLGHVRCQQVKVLAHAVAGRAPIEGPPPVVIGDMNAAPDSDEMRYMRGLTGLGGDCVYFADCWIVAGDGSPGLTYDRANPYALRSREPSQRIDYIFVRGPDRNLRGEPISARLALDTPTNGVWPSDHHAVVAEIWAAPRPHDPY